MRRRLKTQYSNNVLLLDALLTILTSFNRGISANKINVKAKQELLALLQRTAEQDQRLLAQMQGPPSG